jgi:hypothetical protein
MRTFNGISTLILHFVVLIPVARAADDKDIRQAVERGVESLRTRQDGDGSWSFGNAGHTVGTSALVGLAILECDVPGDDQAVKDAARVVRNGVGSINDTYDISLAVMFLDRLGLADDDRLIEDLSHRLIAGQGSNGGWGYFCPHVSSEARRLRTGGDKKNTEPRDKQDAQKQNAPNQGRRGNLQNDPRNFAGFFGDDNSNTQFATLALWIARRHHVKVDAALRAVENRFRKSQNADGGWGYKSFASGGMMGGLMTNSTASMTCAGLLGLAVGYGVSTPALHTNIKPKAGGDTDKENPELPRDAAVNRGLDLLARVLQPALRGDDDDPPAMRGFGRGGPGLRGGMRGGGMGGIVHNGLGSEYYFLWSLERVAMVYSLKMLGDKDWYAIGSRYLLQNQERDGAWRGNLGSTVDTCFALFFLRRANLAVDLTAKLRVKGPAVVDLRAKAPVGDGEKGPKMAPEKPNTPKENPDRLAAKKNEARSTAPDNPAPTKAGETPPAPKAATKERASADAKPEPPAAKPPLPKPDLSLDQQIDQLREALLKAAPVEQLALIDRLRDTKGAVNTESLAAAIPTLSGEIQAKAREALAQRLSRMTAETLRDKLREDSSEIRRAAALACAMKDEKSLIPDLIGLLEDSEARVERAAYASLKALTSEDFGPAANANEDRRSRSISRWREWWAKQSQSTKQ